MAKKVISFNLSPQSIREASEEIRKYKSSLERKCEILCERVINECEWLAQGYVNESPLGKTIVFRSNITKEEAGYKAVLIATGKIIENDGYAQVNTLLLVEFGAGIYYNATANPKATEFGMGVGTFPDQKHAFEQGWYFMKEDGTWVFTHGVKATMPMYKAITEIRDQVRLIAKEVFA